MISVALIAPNVLGAMKRLGLLPSLREKEVIKTARARLVRQGLLTYEGRSLCLTPKGERALRFLELHEFKLKKPRRWDEKWRVLIFDIPEGRRATRDKIRHMLQEIGFMRLQDSVWVYPYDCEDLITLLKADFKIGKDLLYLIVDTLEYDKPLRHHFGLR
jgi:DNA-binding transcriptional regulator PaaX